MDNDDKRTLNRSEFDDGDVKNTIQFGAFMVIADNGAKVNFILASTMAKLNHSKQNLVKTGVTITDFKGAVTHAWGVLSIFIQVDSRVIASAFFVVDASASYNALLGRDWIHAIECMPSTLY
ncbi:hypothetical protein CRG98_018586 [Punica granatum]|uniref:Uncharacterized protein n=1 Tax=Punica granatum TaxID=22663 RepID=A0A2I0JXI4_PUNGR|nr:hypothetical protein CRG98_018586 [Punica granatum]